MTEPNQSGGEALHREMVLECNLLAKQFGERFARTIMQTTVLNELEPDLMERLIRYCVDNFRTAMLEGGASAHDAEAVTQWMYAALVKEGARLARTITWEGGHA